MRIAAASLIVFTAPGPGATLASPPSLVLQEPAPPAPAQPIRYEELLAALHSSDLVQQWETMQRFAEQPDAPAAIAPLLEEMRKSAPALDNNVGLVVELILLKHPDAPCALEPLLEAIHRHVWNSQQKCAQALQPLLERGDGKGREKELAASLIPLLTSQRPRVFDAGRRCLEALTARTLGDVPEPWLAWYEQEFGQRLDLTGAVYEDLIVIRPRIEGTGEDAPVRFQVDGEEVATVAELRARIEARRARAQERSLVLGVVIQITNERMSGYDKMKEIFASRDVSAVVSLLGELKMHDVVVSPMSDGFRAPWKPVVGTPQPR